MIRRANPAHNLTRSPVDIFDDRVCVRLTAVAADTGANVALPAVDPTAVDPTTVPTVPEVAGDDSLPTADLAQKVGVSLYVPLHAVRMLLII